MHHDHLIDLNPVIESNRHEADVAIKIGDRYLVLQIREGHLVGNDYTGDGHPYIDILSYDEKGEPCKTLVDSGGGLDKNQIIYGWSL